MSVLALNGAVRGYDWGSPTAIPQLLGVEPDGAPVAELWFGAHPEDPSLVPAFGCGLDAVLAGDPAGLLGAAVVEQFGPRLPYLLKLLAADSALSIQVHPTLAQARAGFAAEDAVGISRDAPERNYRDANHKPELLCALTPFEALCGFRPVAETLAVLRALEAPALGFLVELLQGPDPLRSAFTALVTLDDPAELVAAVTARATEDGPLRPSWLAARDFPGDVGVVLTLLLNHVRLDPGQAIFLGAGNVHCYLRGTAIEIMASSDNVLRGGLTGKHVDVPELLRITDFAELSTPRWPATNGAFAVPVRDFWLAPLDVDGAVALAGAGPRIALCTAGAVDVGGVELTPGHAAFVSAGESARLAGAGQVFVAGVG